MASADYATTSVPWINILAYDGSLINPRSDGKSFQGLYGDGTNGYGEYEVKEEGGVDEFNLSFGGNVKDVLYWGLSVGITDINYKTYTYYGEALDNAYIKLPWCLTRYNIVMIDSRSYVTTIIYTFCVTP